MFDELPEEYENDDDEDFPWLPDDDEIEDYDPLTFSDDWSESEFNGWDVDSLASEGPEFEFEIPVAIVR